MIIYLSKGISRPVFYGDLVYKLKRVIDTPKFISSGSKIVKRLRRRQYDPLIIDRTIGLVLGPCTALYKPFLKHCTLTNKAVGLYDGPWPNLLRGDKVLIFVPSDCWSGLLQPSDLSSLSAGRSIACPIRMSLYIFLLSHIYHLCFTCIDFYDLSAWSGCWIDVYIRFIYKIWNVWPFDYTAVAGSGNVWPVNQVNHTSLVAVVTPTDRHKSVRNRCLIELFWGVLCVFTLPFWYFGCRGFCHRTESDLLLFVFISHIFVLLLLWMNCIS